MGGDIRRLITAASVRQAAREGRGLDVAPGARITEEARDLAQRLGVSLVEKTPEPSVAHGGLRDERRVQVVLGSDHGGYELKSALMLALAKAGYSLRDVGCQGRDAVDYPDFALAVAQAVARGEAARGVMVDSIGVASAMVCNRVAGCRAAACESLTSALSSRRHNNANILTLGATLQTSESATGLVLAWLAEPYDGGRHQRRVDKIMALDAPGGRLRPI
jgi:ribose 5-phosphate isomerase B